MEIIFEKLDLENLKDTTILLFDDKLELDEAAKFLDQKHHGLITKTALNTNIFEPKFGSMKSLTTTDKEGNVKVFLLICLGKQDELESFQIEQIGGKIYQALCSLKSSAASVIVSKSIKTFGEEDIAALIAHGSKLASYRFDKYRTKLTDKEKPQLKQLHLSVKGNIEEASEKFNELDALAQGVFLARDFITEPPNKLYPDSYAAKIVEDLEPLGIEVEVLGEREMKNLGMGALLGVGQGSINESKLVIMKYNGLDDDSSPVAFIGKGVTFDTGGISLKPAGGMEDMKYDMAGSAAVVGVIKALALRKAKVNAVGVVGLVENMPGGNAQRPSDVVTSMSGQTIEVLNTDAEGRLVLADALWYTQDKYKPKFMVDLATLTGAIVISLGSAYAGLFSNNEELTERLISSGKKVNEKLWAFPLSKEYDEMIKSSIADVANITQERGAGSITAAQFLQRFVNETPWAHLDIAGVAWNKKGNDITPKGAVGFGVRLLNQMVKDYYESN
ncbi:MAG: leucyl aminopeptidase [Rickettsiaceae bacterium]|jgi:leucyl aminopeptidase|nr:leucyl aminopeptidase [Rickettsiaceae bacterium]